jgi:hypothetical protein
MPLVVYGVFHLPSPPLFLTGVAMVYCCLFVACGRAYLYCYSVGNDRSYRSTVNPDAYAGLITRCYRDTVLGYCHTVTMMPREWCPVDDA